jgi:GTP1/Obg family GTP-binding protein
MELLTIATLEHLPTAALFVFDLTEECGCDVQQQWLIRRELRSRFPHKLWIDVITKADMLEEELDQAALLGAQDNPVPSAVPEDAVQAVHSVASFLRVAQFGLCCTRQF